MNIRPTHEVIEEDQFENFLSELQPDQVKLWHEILGYAREDYVRPENHWKCASNAYSYILRMQKICAERLDKHS